MNEKFELNDVVTAFGVRGVVKEVRENSDFPVKVSFEGGETLDIWSFTLDGKYFVWAKEPSLKIIEKAKKEEPKKKYYRMAYRDRAGGPWFISILLVEENFRDTLGDDSFTGYERKLLTDWSVEL
jgi:hypothetical protein